MKKRKIVVPENYLYVFLLQATLKCNAIHNSKYKLNTYQKSIQTIPSYQQYTGPNINRISYIKQVYSKYFL